jgi:hypothetical protein
MRSKRQEFEFRFAGTKTGPSAAGAGIGSLRVASSRAQLAWTDFHTVLVIAQHGSVARACAVLGMTHSTLLRKLDQIEHRYGAFRLHGGSSRCPGD